jgi:hypothetical protein
MVAACAMSLPRHAPSSWNVSLGGTHYVSVGLQR